MNLRSTWTYSRQGIVSKFFGHHPEAVKEDELSYVIGKEAATQKKIEKVCPCMCSNFGMCMVIYRARVQMSQLEAFKSIFVPAVHTLLCL